VTAKNAAIGVQFVNDDVLQVLKEARPFCVVRQDAAVQHVGIGQDDVALLTDGLPRIGWSIAVIGKNAEPVPSFLPNPPARQAGPEPEPWWDRCTRRVCRDFRAQHSAREVVAERFP